MGPGFASIKTRPFPRINELVWSQVIPFPNPTDLATDLPKIRSKVAEMRKHFNSYGELKDARRHLAAGDLKAGVRAAAPAVEAIVRYHCKLWDVEFPRKGSFDEKIEAVLAAAGKPAYRAVDQTGLQCIRYLYRARNAMHEGDNFYNDDHGELVEIDRDKLDQFLDAAEAFIVWIDSLA